MMSKKIFWDLLTIMMAAVLCVSNISCSSDSDEDSGGGSSWTSKSNVLVGTWENTYGNYEDSRNYYEYRTIYTFNANNTGKHQNIYTGMDYGKSYNETYEDDFVYTIIGDGSLNYGVVRLRLSQVRTII